jgi:hypothetical protein
MRKSSEPLCLAFVVTPHYLARTSARSLLLLCVGCSCELGTFYFNPVGWHVCLTQ